MEKIVIIVPYFGTFPNNFNLWLKSCEENKNIDFLIITDIKINNKISKNIHIVNMNIEELRNLIEYKLNEKIKMNSLHKLCDFKPTYGIIFSDYIEKYDYWGYCDVDMIFGDLEKFFVKYNLKKYDKFLKLGHLSLYRNTVEVNNRYKMSHNWKNVLNTEKTIGFDEKNGINEVYFENKFPIFQDCIYADISAIYKRFRLSFKEKNYKNQIFYKKNNQIYRKYWINNQEHIDEFIYIHFQKRKLPKEFFDYTHTKSFLITKKGFFKLEENEDIVLEQVKEYNKYPGILYEKAEFLLHKLKMLKKRIKNIL